MAALSRFSHLAADTIVNGGATSHLAPTDPADRKSFLVAGPGCFLLSPTGSSQRSGDKSSRQVVGQGMWGPYPGSKAKAPLIDLPFTPTGLIDTCRECGARALELMGHLQDRTVLPRAQPSLMRAPLQGILQLGQVRCAAEAECGLKRA